MDCGRVCAGAVVRAWIAGGFALVLLFVHGTALWLNTGTAQAQQYVSLP
jgi:hypothetical protein